MIVTLVVYLAAVATDVLALEVPQHLLKGIDMSHNLLCGLVAAVVIKVLVFEVPQHLLESAHIDIGIVDHLLLLLLHVIVFFFKVQDVEDVEDCLLRLFVVILLFEVQEVKDIKDCKPGLVDLVLPLLLCLLLGDHLIDDPLDLGLNLLDEVGGAAVVVRHPLDFRLALSIVVTLCFGLCILVRQHLDLGEVDAATVDPLGLGDHLGVDVLLALRLVLVFALVLDVLDKVSSVAVVGLVVVLRQLAEASKAISFEDLDLV